MAWRIDEHVIRGEIDNRTRGRVTGRIWFAGRTEPVELNLNGNAWRDLAGRRLEFVNPTPKPGLADGFAGQQYGTTGDITASRKVKVPDIPLDQIAEYFEAGKPWPWHWGNCLYLEWFSRANGRVVIESASYQLTISPDTAWDMSDAEESTQRHANAATLGGFMEQVGEAVAAAAPADDDNRPLTEAEAEKLQADSDKLMDRITARMEREGDAADYDKILSEELERARRERGEPDLTPEQEEERARWIDEMNAAADEALKMEKSESWKRDADGGRDGWPTRPLHFNDRHPLAARAFALTLRVMREPRGHGWIPQDAIPEHPVLELIVGISKASAKLAGALNGGGDWPPPLEFCATKIVRLKKAAGYLDDALLAAESCREESLTAPAWLNEVACETTALATATSTLIGELRALLKSGGA